MASWKLGTTVYAVVLSTSGSQNVSFDLPTGTLGPAQSLFPERPATLTFGNGKLTGSISGLVPQVYVFGDHATGMRVPRASAAGSSRASTVRKQISVRYSLSGRHMTCRNNNSSMIIDMIVSNASIAGRPVIISVRPKTIQNHQKSHLY